MIEHDIGGLSPTAGSDTHTLAEYIRKCTAAVSWLTATVRERREIEIALPEVAPELTVTIQRVRTGESPPPRSVNRTSARRGGSKRSDLTFRGGGFWIRVRAGKYARPRTASQILVGIPAYNEGASIGRVVAETVEYADDVLVVDDGSTDRTAAMARTAGATVVEHAENRGYGAALKTIFEEADRRDVDHLVLLDGDGQHDATDIPELVEEQRETDADIVIGSRFSGESETEMRLYRRVGVEIVNLATNLSLGIVRPRSWIRDTQSGFRTYNETAIGSLAADDTLSDRMSAITDILYHADQLGYDIAETGTTIDYDVENANSHNPITHGLVLVGNILKTATL
jgi:hypothetical protein